MGELGEAFGLYERGAFDDAERLCRAIVGREPRNAQAYYLLCLTAQKQGDRAKAETFIDRALELAPEQAFLHRIRGTLLLARDEFAEAVASFGRALAANPGDRAALNNIGIAHLGCRNFEAAEEALRQAIEIEPSLAVALYNLGNVMGEKGEPAKAASWYRRALGASESHADAAFELLVQLYRMADWPGVAQLTPIVDRFNEQGLTNQDGRVEPPLFNLLRRDDPAENLRIARQHARNAQSRAARLAVRLQRSSRRASPPLHLGYLTSDIGRHATTHLCAGLFPGHDRRRFQVHLYSFGADDRSAERRQAIADVDRFVDIAKVDAPSAAQKIAGDGIDVLIDLKGHTRGARLEIAALRPAPVQVHWLGFPGTIGGDFFDYLIADRLVLPDDQFSFYTEKILRLPHSYQVTDNRTEFRSPIAREAAGLPADGFVMCCFNQIQKIDPVMFSLWLDLLRELPNSVLWLLRSNADAETNLYRAVEAGGISRGRLIFARPIERGAHLSRLRLADLALDTRIYNGHTTTSDALWQGVPVLTLRGRHFASRVSASLLTAIDLPELIAKDMDHYRRFALALGRDRAGLRALKAKLQAKRKTAPLFDTARFIANLERAYEAIWARHLAGLRPAHMDIEEEASEPGAGLR